MDNVAALERVLRDAERHRVSHYWILGDLVAYGPRPVEVMDRVSGMIPAIDRLHTPAEHRVLADAREGPAWTRARLVGAARYDWLDGLRLDHRVRLPDGTSVLLVHASPGRDDGCGPHPDRSDSELTDVGFSAKTADLILVGHTHLATDRRVSRARVVNPGSVSLPPGPDDRARWALVTGKARGYTVEFPDVSWDVGAVVSDLDRQHHPSRRWLRRKLTVPHAGGDVASKATQ